MKWRVKLRVVWESFPIMAQIFQVVQSLCAASLMESDLKANFKHPQYKSGIWWCRAFHPQSKEKEIWLQKNVGG